MERAAQPRGPQPAIPMERWTEIQVMDRERKTLAQIAAWLLDQHGLKVSRQTVMRTLDKIRAAEQQPPLAIPEVKARTSEDELLQLKRHFRRQIYSKSESARDQQGAARLLLAVMKLKGELQPTPSASGAQPTATSPAICHEPPAPVLTDEERAERVRKFLGKAN